MLNYADLNSFSDLFSVNLRTINHLNLKYLYFFRYTRVVPVNRGLLL